MRKFLKTYSKEILTLTLLIFLFVFIPDVAFADIDASGEKLWRKLAKIAKWVIIVKGCIDVIQSILNGDVQNAKQQFLGYLLCFAIIHGLPAALDEIEGVFNDV